MEKEFEAPPMSGGDLPLKELGKEKIEKPLLKKANSKLLLAAILLTIVFSLILGVMIGFLIRKKTQPRTTVSPNSSLKPQASTKPLVIPPELESNLGKKLDDFKKNLEEIDLKEVKLNPPLLDYKIRFKLKK